MKQQGLSAHGHLPVRLRLREGPDHRVAVLPGEKDADDQLRGEAPLPFPFGGAAERSPVVCDEPDEPEIPPESIIGLAYSKHGLYTDINGKTVMYPEELERTAEKYRREKKRLANMKNGSKNREKQRIKTKRIIEKLERQRTDFLHKESRQIANACDCVCVRDPAGSINDIAWGMFTTFLQYKMADAGKSFIKSNAPMHCAYERALA